MTNSLNKPPIWFWIVSAIALLWNAMGVMVYIGDAYITKDMIAQLPERQQAFYTLEMPAWYTACYALAVFCGLLGCIFLLLRKTWAKPMFIISFIAVIGQILHNYVLNNIYDKMNLSINTFELSMAIAIPVVAMLLVLFSRDSARKGWIK
ncbi:hypothetical protein [uncultured Winogradskyella sp.]|uniref:hypothetical protein n=1 Tax=uncultured Winogradskyella sp. TaxID=395353 RepID=UPI0026087B68|nr:hypothetical protein [uncultured Winogradskyella sp.]